MGYDVRHESRSYLQALGNASAEIGQYQRDQETWKRGMEEERLRLQQQSEADAMARFQAQLNAQQQAQQAGFEQQRQMQQMETQGRSDLVGQEYQLRNQYYQNLEPRFRYTQSQLRDADRIRNAIYKIQTAQNLRPQQKQQAVNRLMQQLAGIQPIPQLMQQPQQQTPVQEAYRDRVFIDKERGGMWILQPDEKLEFRPFDNPDTVKHADIAKLYETARKVLTKYDGDGKEIPPSQQEIEDFVNQRMLPLSRGGASQGISQNPFIGLPASSSSQGASKTIVPFSNPQSTMTVNPRRGQPPTPQPTPPPLNPQPVKMIADGIKSVEDTKTPEFEARWNMLSPQDRIQLVIALRAKGFRF